VKQIVLCSNHPMLLAGFQSVMQGSEEFSVSVCRSSELLLDQVQNLRADIVLADMYGDITLSFLSDLKRNAPATALILWVDDTSAEFAFQALGAGVSGLLRKNSEAAVYLDCLRQIAAGKRWIENDLNERLLHTRSIRLTPRERQLMFLLTQGLKNKEIAYRMGVTSNTVKTYLTVLYSKVGASDRFELALLALKNLTVDQTDVPKSVKSSIWAEAPMVMPALLGFESVTTMAIQ
jgi:DNA-binding NarL/FixJ family response regulator